MARWWYRFTLYLPVGVMAVLALISYWLVRTAPAAQQGAPVVLASTAPDYF